MPISNNLCDVEKTTAETNIIDIRSGFRLLLLAEIRSGFRYTAQHYQRVLTVTEIIEGLALLRLR